MTVLYRALIIIALTSLSLMAQAQSSGPDWTQAKEIDITMTNFAFVPDSLDLTTGVAYHLHFVNSGSSDHNFTSPKLFDRANIMPADAGKLHDGIIEVPTGGTIDVRLISEMPGTYEFHCSHFMHAMFGMRGHATVR